MDTNNEYDDNPAGATGWACYQDTAGKDSLGLHPFGNDWEFAMVLDPEYLNLVSYGNTALQSGHIEKPDSKQDYWQDLPALGIPSADIANAAKFGLLGVEMENGLVPPSSKVSSIMVIGLLSLDGGLSTLATPTLTRRFTHPFYLPPLRSILNNLPARSLQEPW